MIDFDSPTGKRTLQRLASEQIIWLTTVSPSGIPQPRPVWFIWDGEYILVYSEQTAYKTRHITANPHVALHFNSTPDGDDIQVILGTARVDPHQPLANDNNEYLLKYRDGIRAIGMNESSFAQTFDTAILIQPTRIRGLDPLPEA